MSETNKTKKRIGILNQNIYMVSSNDVITDSFLSKDEIDGMILTYAERGDMVVYDSDENEWVLEGRGSPIEEKWVTEIKID